MKPFADAPQRLEARFAGLLYLLIFIAAPSEVVTKLFSVTVKEKSTINPTELTLRIFANCGAVLSGVEERLRQIGCPKHIRDAL